MTMDFFAHVDASRYRVRRPRNAASRASLEVEGETLKGEAMEPEPMEPEPMELELALPTPSPVRSVRLGGRSLRVLPHRDSDGVWTLEVEGRRYRAQVLDRGQEAVRQARRAAGGGGGLLPLKAPMPGLVVRVEVAEGDEVAAGQGLVIVEAMKMENELKATRSARVRAVHVVAGATVEKDAVLVEFEAMDSDTGTDPSRPGEDA